MGKSTFLEYESDKSEEFKKNQKLNELLSELIELLKPIQKEVEGKISELKYPPLLIVGAPRSGTTLFTQWIASLGTHSYGSNFLTRFAYAPYIGALIQKMIFDDDYDFHGDFHDISSKVNLKSNLGKSKGALAVNEFQHFFRNYMDNFDPEFLDEAEFKKVNVKGLLAGLASIEAVFKKPFCTKAFMIQYNIEQLWGVSKKMIFVHTERDPIFNMQSILFAREKYYKTKDIWLGAKPKEYDYLKSLDVNHQIAGQVYYTNKAIKSALSSIPEKNKIIIKYEGFCNDPGKYYHEIREKYKAHGYALPKSYSGISSFNNTNKIMLTENEVDKLKLAYNYFHSI